MEKKEQTSEVCVQVLRISETSEVLCESKRDV